MFKTILVALDGSKHADNALGVAIDLACKYDAELMLYHAIVAHTMRAQYESRVGDVARNVYKEIGAEIAGEVLDAAETRAREAGAARVRKISAEGNPAQGIIETASREGADLIVMGSRGLTGFHGFVVGSVAQKVITLADCPVIVAK